jgi:rhodanese-related sulfurtransferase
MIDEDYQGAMASFRLALAQEPNSLEARFGLARCLDTLGHPEESVDLIKEVLRRDPLNPQNSLRDQQLGMALLMSGRTAEAAEWLRRASAGSPVPLEYTEMATIAALGLTGHEAEAQAKYVAYAQRWPHRTAWRLACYATKAQATLPGFKAMSAALEAAGMPDHADETADDGVPPAAAPREAGDFEPTPLTLPGAPTLTTPALAAFLRDNPPAFVIDVGCGGAVAPNALWLSWVESDTLLGPKGRNQLRDELDRNLRGDHDRPIVVMGSGAYGWGSYNAALTLLALGYRHVLWHRGGEEAWAAAGQPSEDRRDR